LIISLLLAADENNVIGKDNKLPWHLPNDLRYFKNLTWGMPIVMGRKTFESIGKPLPGRQNIVISRNETWSSPGVEIAHNIEDAREIAASIDVSEIFFIGGAEIFNSALPNANRIYLTRIHSSFDGDVFFTWGDQDQWMLTSSKSCEADKKNPYPHTFQVWERTP
jgi:dihydrofolate reductase